MENVFTTFIGTMLAIIGAWFIFILQQKWQMKQRKYQDYFDMLGKIHSLVSRQAIRTNTRTHSSFSPFEVEEISKAATIVNKMSFSTFTVVNVISPQSQKIINRYVKAFLDLGFDPTPSSVNSSHAELSRITLNTAQELAKSMEDDLNIRTSFRKSKKPQ